MRVDAFYGILYLLLGGIASKGALSGGCHGFAKKLTLTRFDGSPTW
ncbi:MAG: hypothetical protein JO031_14005 [Ktedonobacteraceae bacterium]|nr:hypothetical protein [Ktedonobacteraceae bacterium]